MAQRGMRFGLVSVVLFWCSIGTAQTTAGLSTTIVFPVSAQTPSFGNEVTLYNPGPNALTASVSFYEGNNSGTPGPKVCNDVVVSANRSVQITLGSQCALGIGGHFGLLVVADKAVPPSNAFYGYMRVQTPQGQGFSVEGFPVTNFNNQVSHSVGLKRQAAAPTFQTNCFVASLNQAVSYELRLFNDTTGAQIGGTLSGSLQPFQQFRYLDVFGVNGVNALAGDQLNVRAQFTPTSGGSANLIGFCTVQDNASLGADFRIAKSFGSPSGSFFVQGGNAFGNTAVLGTTDNQSLTMEVNGQPALRVVPASPDNPAIVFGFNPNVIGGQSGNFVTAGKGGATIGGGGGCNPAVGGSCGAATMNRVTGNFGTIGGGRGNIAGEHDTASGGDTNSATGGHSTVGGGQNNLADSNYATVAGGVVNHAGGVDSTVGGGLANSATGQAATVPGGSFNVASGTFSVATGHDANAVHANSFIWNGWSSGSAGTFRNNAFQIHAENGLDVEFGSRRPDGGGNSWVFMGTGFVGQHIATSTGAFLSTGGVWVNSSDRNRKTQVRAIDPHTILAAVISLPISTWQYVDEASNVRHLGPMAQDFRAAFGLGMDETAISTVDADGVALAAIQGLHRVMQEKDAQINAQARELVEVRGRLARIEALLLSQTPAR
jgi:endosialidase-like protein